MVDPSTRDHPLMVLSEALGVAEVPRPLDSALLERALAAEVVTAACPSPRAQADWLRAVALELEWEGAPWGERSVVHRCAAERDPTSFRAHLSHCIGAAHVLDHHGPDSAVLAEGRAAADRALACAVGPAERAEAHYGRGLLEHHGGTAPELCRAYFEDAVRLAPDHPMYRLHVADCFRDAADWPRAVAAYRLVDAEALVRDWGAWRETHRRARLVECLAEMGAYSIARDGAVTLLYELERCAPDELARRVTDLWDLERTVRRYFMPLHPRLAALGRSLGRS